ncbi:MAG: ribosomal protein S18-alanine N-acetyltransferase [Lachnospiraceae bacterium]|nr:ribosomal protein S18-alanine N-acetyltransferase [Lachnospiraceae bacterium]
MIAVREACPADLPALAALERACFPDPWSAESLRSGLARPENRFFVLEDGREVRAYAAVRTVLEEAELLRIAVDPAFRGRGSGRILLEEVLQAVPEAAVWRLDVRAGNTAALRLYERCGFEKLVLNRGFYTDPAEDGWLMQRGS